MLAKVVRILLEPEHLLELGIVIGAWAWFYAIVLGPRVSTWPWWLWIGLAIFVVAFGTLVLQFGAAAISWRPTFEAKPQKRSTPASPQPAMNTPRPQLDDKTVVT